MKNRFLITVLVLLVASGCSAPLKMERDYEKISDFEYSKDEINDLTYCNFISPNFNRASVCILTDTELAVYWSRDLGEQTKRNLLFKFEFDEIRKIAQKGNGRARQIQVLAKSIYFAVELVPDELIMDQKKTQQWYDFMQAKGVESFEAKVYMTGPVKQYQIIYK